MLLITYSLLLRLNTIHLDEAIRFFKQTTIITFEEIIIVICLYSNYPSHYIMSEK